MNEFMKVAKEIADSNLITNAGGPFGAVIVKDGKIVGKGSNHVLKNNDPTAHAEVMAIRDACKNLNTYDLNGCELYTNSYPCPMCFSAIMWANISMVYYGNNRDDAKRIGFIDDYMYNTISKINNNEDIPLKMECIDREETIKTFDEFMKKVDKTIY